MRARTVLVSCLAAVIDSSAMRGMGACRCSGVADGLRARSDYGAFCASWDAADEKPWCTVDSPTACGKVGTFEGSPGVFWSHLPCTSHNLVPEPPALPRLHMSHSNTTRAHTGRGTGLGTRQAGREIERTIPGLLPWRRAPPNQSHVGRGTYSSGAPGRFRLKVADAAAAAAGHRVKVQNSDYAMNGNGAGSIYSPVPGAGWDPPGAMWGPQPSPSTMTIIKPLRLLLCAAAKVGSETWRRFAERAWPLDAPGGPNPKYDGYRRVTLRELSPDRAQMLLQDSMWVKAAFVREPAERLLSAFLNKVHAANDSPISISLYRLNLGLDTLPGTNYNKTELERGADLRALNFAQFIDIVERQARTKPQNMNIHWNLQSMNCGISQWRAAFGFVGCFEHISADSKCLLQSLVNPTGSKARTAWDTFGRFGWHNGGRIFPPHAGAAAVEGGHATQAHAKMKKYYTPQLLRRVHEIYRADYELFGEHCGWTNVLSK